MFVLLTVIPISFDEEAESEEIEEKQTGDVLAIVFQWSYELGHQMRIRTPTNRRILIGNGETVQTITPANQFIQFIPFIHYIHSRTLTLPS